jgi:ATP-dependent Clp protease protease subunit
MATITELTDNLAYGVDIKNRRIYFGINLDAADAEDSTSFTLSSVEYAIRALHRMATEAPGKPIEIHMCSYGGDPYSMLRLYDEIHACPCQIKFYGGGAIMSAATWIMAGSDERYLHPNATVMVHDGTDGFEGKHTDHQIQASEEKRLQERLYDIYAENSRMPKEFWQDVCQRDLYLTAHEAVSLGLADKIVEPKKRGNLRKARHASLKKEQDVKEMKKLINDIYLRINKVKVPKIEFNEIKKEPADPHIVVDENKMPDVTPASPVKTET